MVTACFERLLRRVLLIALLLPGLAQAVLQAQVDRNPVALDESFNLTLRSSDSGDDPDLNVLKRDFDLLGQSKSSAIQIVNGNFSRSTEWRITLSPKHAGPVLIPAVRAGNQTSQPIALNVTAATPPAAAPAQGRSDLFVEVEAAPRTVYVQQQIVFVVRLYRSVNLGNDSTLSEPEFPRMDAIVKKLGEDRAFQTLRNGQAYAVTERRYAVFPQQSGAFGSAPVIFDGEVLEGDNGLFAFDPFEQGARPVRMRSASLAFTVKPMPPGLGRSAWLPAQSLQLEEAWSENPPMFTVGEPVTRTLRIRARGLTAAQLPALDAFPGEGVKLYPDQAVLKDTPDDAGITGLREQKIALIPTRPGALVLPAIEVRWWDTRANREAVARLPARQVSVLPGRAVSNPTQAQGAPLSRPSSARPLPPSPASRARPVLGFDTANAWFWLSQVLATGWILTLFVLWRRRLPAASAPAPAFSQPVMRAQLEKQIQRACLANDAPGTQSQLLAWAARQWPDDPPASLGVLAARCAPPLSAAVLELDRSLYAKSGGAWQGQTLWRASSQHKPGAPAATRDEKDPLEPLYKHNG